MINSKLKVNNYNKNTSLSNINQRHNKSLRDNYSNNNNLKKSQQ